MSDKTMSREQLLNDWARVQEMFGQLAQPQLLAKVGRQEALQGKRGALLLQIEHSKPVIYFMTWQHFDDILHPGQFKQGLFAAINQYDLATQSVVVVSFDDVALNQSLNYQWFGIDIVPSDDGQQKQS